MQTNWVLSTKGDPLSAVQHFLYDLWPFADIIGMLVQKEPGEETCPAPSLLKDPASVLTADPFLPIVTTNAAKLMAEISQKEYLGRLGAVLRPCEVRALYQNEENNSIDPIEWLIIGVDCLGSYPVEDYSWRLEKAGTAEQLTRQELRNARQGGISPDRYRAACQMCLAADLPEVAVSIGVLGLPVKEQILVTVKDWELARRLHLEQITDGPAPLELVEQHERIKRILSGRRGRSQGRIIEDLPIGLPDGAESFMNRLDDCMPCQDCLLVCPVYESDWQPMRSGGPAYWEAFEEWLASCVGCGMCEEACPNHLPLTAIHTRIKHPLEKEIIQVPG